MDSVEIALRDAHQRSWAYILASVVRFARDLDLAEDAVQDAFVAALESWRRDGIPNAPAAWLITAAKRKVIDRIRRDASLDRKLPLLIVPEGEPDMEVPSDIPDERLRLIFTCCHPALNLEARVALTLRLVCGLTTPEVARLFVVTEPTMAARITRAKKKIAVAGIPYRVPEAHELPDRLPAVLSAIYLVFTEGHAASSGTRLIREELTTRAIDLARILTRLMPDEPEVIGLLALITLADARSVTRIDQHQQFVPLHEQDRARWNREQIQTGTDLVERALRLSANRVPGPFALQAAIGALHAEAPTFEETDWPQVLALYDLLLEVVPSPVVALNRSVAISKIEGPAAALRIVDQIADSGALATYPFLAATRADLLRQLGQISLARTAYETALSLTTNSIDRTYLRNRLNAL
ncbi:MAG: RNA polymerase sigma factor [Thermomicrobiales bacterium]